MLVRHILILFCFPLLLAGAGATVATGTTITVYHGPDSEKEERQSGLLGWLLGSGSSNK